MISRAALVIAALLCAAAARAQGFDHAHATWDALLGKHVVLITGGRASQVRYRAMMHERGVLTAYLRSLSDVSQAEFDDWSRAERMAFLINAYNAFMVEKVLTRYPDIRSVWDFGRLFGNPFRDEFFTLFGRKFSLDGIEHRTLRKPGAYDEPRLHYVLNCAAVGCPMLREEAYVAARLESQLEEQAVRFLSDRSRNRYARGRLEVSSVFDWYGEDFGDLGRYFSRYAPLLADAADARRIIAGGRAPRAFLDYDWSLNDFPSSSRR